MEDEDIAQATACVRGFIKTAFETNEKYENRLSNDSYSLEKERKENRYLSKYSDLRESGFGYSYPPPHHPEFEKIVSGTRDACGKVEVETSYHHPNFSSNRRRIYQLILEENTEWRIDHYFELATDEYEESLNYIPASLTELNAPDLDGDLRLKRNEPDSNSPGLFDLSEYDVENADLGSYFPALAELEKPCIILHPRAVAEPLPVNVSKLGGTFVQPPSDSPWPFCQHHNTPYIGAIQLLQHDFPLIEFPAGKTLLQIFWCPFEDGKHWKYDDLVSKWLPSSDADNIDEQCRNPDFRQPQLDDRIPRESRLHLQNYRDYPNYQELPFQVKKTLTYSKIMRKAGKIYDEELELDAGVEGAWGLYSHIGPVTVSKVGGYPRCFIHDDFSLDCKQCGGPMDFLLSLSSGENEKRWVPVEDSYENPFSDPGFQFSRSYELNIFTCRKCPDWPVAGLIG